MNKLSLRLRITLLVGLLLVLLTTVLTIVSIWSANHYFVMPLLPENSVIFTPLPEIILPEIILDSQPPGSAFTPIPEGAPDGMQTEIEFDEMDLSQGVIQLTVAQRGFSLQSIAVLIVIIILGLGVTYWIMGRALRPLTVLSETIYNISAHNLSKPIEEPVARDEVGSITASFNGMLDRLRSSFEQQRRFSASAAHELKTPLATMKTSLQVLRLEDSPSAEEYRDTVLMMEQNVDRLISTVNDLLLLSSEGKPELNDEISLRTLFCEIAEELQEAMQEKQLCCILPQNDCLMTGSHMLLRSAFYNLFENAVKYNKDGGTVEVTVQKTPDGKTAVSICDTGIGMSEEEIQQVFEPFFRANRRGIRQIPGNGLGMSIIRTIIERHGGEIHVESKVDMGTNVMVVL